MTDQALRRKQRLAAALRENLKRRKAQQRVRSVPEPSGPDATATAPQATTPDDAGRITSLAPTGDR